MTTDLNTMSRAVGAAMEASTDGGKRRDWVRVARVRSLSDPKPGENRENYVLAVRPTGTAKGFQFGCSCPDWIHRKSHTGETCKHQRLFLAFPKKSSSIKDGVWLYRAGQAFLRVVR